MTAARCRRRLPYWSGPTVDPCQDEVVGVGSVAWLRKSKARPHWPAGCGDASSDCTEQKPAPPQAPMPMLMLIWVVAAPQAVEAADRAAAVRRRA
eukprot:6176304-Pleurochrysis_carterae.AAC.1